MISTSSSKPLQIPKRLQFAKQKVKEIKNQILEGKLTFKEAVYKYSDDKHTKFNAGIITGNKRIQQR